MKKNIIIFIALIIAFIIPNVSAYPIYLTPLNVSSDLTPNSTYIYEFNFTTDSGCANVLLTNTSTIQMDKYGVGFVDIDTSTLSSRPSYLCEVRNGSLRATHEIPDHIASDLFVKNITASNITSNTGIFEYLNTALDKIIEGFFTYLEVDSLNVTSNLTLNGETITSWANVNQSGSGADGIWTNNSGIATYANNVSIGDDLNVSGTLYFGSDLIPNTTLTNDIGSGTNRVRWLYAQNISADYADITDIRSTNMNVTNIYITNVSTETITAQYIYNPFFAGYMDMRADPWYLGGTDLEIALNLIVDGNITLNGSTITDWSQVNQNWWWNRHNLGCIITTIFLIQ